MEPVDKDVVKRGPRNVKQPMITTHLIVNVLLSAFIIILGTLWVFKREVSRCLIFLNVNFSRFVYYFNWHPSNLFPDE